MGIVERRERQRSEQRSSILAAARAIAAEGGWQRVTVRGIADRIEYSPPVIYEHFAGKGELLLELRRQGFAKLCETVEHGVARWSDPVARFLALADAYWDFARANPDLYQVMHDLSGARSGDGTPLEESRPLIELTQRVIAEATAHGPGVDVDGCVILLWSALHGISALALTGGFAMDPRYVRTLVRRAARDLLKAWTTA